MDLSRFPRPPAIPETLTGPPFDRLRELLAEHTKLRVERNRLSRRVPELAYLSEVARKADQRAAADAVRADRPAPEPSARAVDAEHREASLRSAALATALGNIINEIFAEAAANTEPDELSQVIGTAREATEAAIDEVESTIAAYQDLLAVQRWLRDPSASSIRPDVQAVVSGLAAARRLVAAPKPKMRAVGYETVRVPGSRVPGVRLIVEEEGASRVEPVVAEPPRRGVGPGSRVRTGGLAAGFPIKR